jgi:hypothetical protein
MGMTWTSKTGTRTDPSHHAGGLLLACGSLGRAEALCDDRRERGVSRAWDSAC